VVNPSLLLGCGGWPCHRCGRKAKIATVREGQLYSLQGKPPDLFLKGAGVVGLDGNSETPVEFRKLCGIE
jgi:hypothetical protein